MKIFKKVLLISSIVLLVLSLGLNVCLFLSSTNRLILKDDEDLRVKLYYNSWYNLSDNQSYTFIHESTTTSAGVTTKTTDTITCTEDIENITVPYKCSMISTLYNNGTSTKTSYFPGDGYKYTVEGTTKTKQAYSDINLYTYFYNLNSSVGNYFLAFLIQDVDDEQINNEIKTSLKFDLGSVSLLKEIDVKKAHVSESTKADVSYTFDGKDRVTFIHYKDGVNPETKYEISYKKTILEFPSFDSYVENGGSN